LYVLDDSAGKTEAEPHTKDKDNRESTPQTPATYEGNSYPYHELCMLSKTTGDMVAGLEMGEVGEQYLAEGNYALALEKFKSCLGILVRVLAKEPQGRRRDLLHHQVQMWMKEAESTKGLLATKGIDDASSRAVTETHDQCAIQ